MSKPLTPLLLLFLLTGCAGKQRFGYPISTSASESVSGRTVELLTISDTRTNRAIDGSFTTNLLEDVRGVVAWELAGNGRFKLHTIPAPNPALNPVAEVVPAATADAMAT